MKKLLAILLLLCCSSMLSAQSNADETKAVLAFVQKAMNFNKVVPQEKVYMHFDNTGYFEDETIWFKAYVTRTDNQRPTDLSKVLYVELLNPSGDVVKLQKWPIDNKGMAVGDMKLDTLLGTGFYEVRAYTRYMTNWGVNACFSRVFPIFKAPKYEGEYSDLTISNVLYKDRNPNNRSLTDSVYATALADGIHSTDVNKTISVRFYPEGGDMIVGKRNRVAVLAVDDNGNPYSADAQVVNADGTQVAQFHTDSLGRGLFAVTPDGGALTLKMNNIKGKQQSFALPAAKQNGCALTINTVDEMPLVTIQSTDAVCGRLLGYVIMHNGNVIHCDTVVAAPLVEVELDRARLGEGVNQFTLFDTHGRIMAERLFFVCPKQNDADSIRIANKTQRLKPCGEIELELTAQPNASISFSAIDAATMNNGKQGNMKTWMLLSSEVKGFISNVDYYFEADDEAHRKSADLLMLIQGWRRYDWSLMTGLTAFEKPQPIEDKFYINGQLKQFSKRNGVTGVSLEAFLFNERGQSLTGTTTTDADGNYAFELPFLDGEWQMQLFTRLNDKRKSYLVGVDRQFSPSGRYISPSEACAILPQAPNLMLRNLNSNDEEFIPITRKNHVLQNVVVKGKQRYFTNDNFRYKDEGYGRRFATLFYDIDKELDNLRDNGEKDPTIFELLCRKNALFNNPECKDLPTPPTDAIDGMWKGHLSYSHRPIKWIVDNGNTQHVMVVDSASSPVIKRILNSAEVSIVDDHDKFDAVTSEAGAAGDDFFPMWADEVKSAYIVPGSPEETDMAVRIYLYMHRRFSTESQKGIRRTYFQGFNTPSTFQMENYAVIPPMEDYRRTIYWNPSVTTDASGKATVRFYNNSTCQDMYISAEGMDADGRMMVNE